MVVRRAEVGGDVFGCVVVGGGCGVGWGRAAPRADGLFLAGGEDLVFFLLSRRRALLDVDER
jgi:hypothetical protein